MLPFVQWGGVPAKWWHLCQFQHLPWRLLMFTCFMICSPKQCISPACPVHWTMWGKQWLVHFPILSRVFFFCLHVITHFIKRGFLTKGLHICMPNTTVPRGADGLQFGKRKRKRTCAPGSISPQGGRSGKIVPNGHFSTTTFTMSFSPSRWLDVKYLKIFFCLCKQPFSLFF